ncbi:MAG: isoleucine--tRNA ligase [Candidatus Puniceispirillaceae bacterium]
MSDTSAKDYKKTVFLPQTDFPMRGGLPKKEPEILQYWQDIDLYKSLRDQRKGAEKFILHDGPPYANGQLHIGHALNKILKDVINRSQSMLGKDANYVPGWDCHGLPIEWKIEEQYRKKGKDKDEVDITEFREECRNFAAHWLDVQSEEFKRLGVLGDFETPYKTMRYESESLIAKEIGKFLMNGGLYRGAKPVMWSPVEKTALAEAEVEYADHKSVTIYACFTVVKTQFAPIEGARIVIWTTTPWTMPGNRALAYGNDITYVCFTIDDVTDTSLAQKGTRLVVAADLLEDTCKAAGIEAISEEVRFTGDKLEGLIASHPLAGHGYDHDVPAFAGDYVTTDQGTGFVHIAPGHGPEDYELAHIRHGVPVPDTVAENGQLEAHLPLFGGMHVLRDNQKIAEIIAEKGGLIAIGSLTHSYPHSWRSKAPVIYRNTAQWFISMASNNLRETALAEIEKTAFYPSSGRTRLSSMIANRPDWCLSRQRAWGVPIPVFVHKQSGEPLRDQQVVDRIVEAFAKDGCDIWFTEDPQRFLGNNYKADDYEQVKDIADVWFDSGSTHAFVLEAREDLQSPADLYLEGSDQHRGWFHSSLLESCGTRGRAPYKGVLTHGFVLDEQGRKMSKSLGNVVLPQKVIEQNGADILRLWVVSSDYYDDLRIGQEIIKRQTDHYRRIRNTLRYLLGAIDGFDKTEHVSHKDMPELEKWLCHRLTEIDEAVRTKSAAYDFHGVFTTLHDFCNADLSAFYFDIRKDRLYCDDPNSVERKATRQVMVATFESLVAWIAPILCFTAEEAWQAYANNGGTSIHMKTYMPLEAGWADEALGAKWARIRKIRSAVTAALEQARNDGKIGGSLQATCHLYLPSDDAALFSGQDLAGLFITSTAEVMEDEAQSGAYQQDDMPGLGVIIGQAEGEKCQRCWKVLPEVDETSVICGRCEDVVSAVS